MRNKGQLPDMTGIWIGVILVLVFMMFILYHGIRYDIGLPYGNAENSKLNCDQLKERLEFEESKGYDENLGKIIKIMELKGCRL